MAEQKTTLQRQPPKPAHQHWQTSKECLLQDTQYFAKQHAARTKPKLQNKQDMAEQYEMGGSGRLRKWIL